MKKNNLLKLLGIALVVAIVSTGIFYGLFVSKLASAPGAGKTLVVAARDLKAGAVLQSADLKTIPWPADQVPSGLFGKMDEVSGKTVFIPIADGEPIVAARLATPQSGGGAGVPEGMRAVSVHVTDSSGVLALLRAGQKIDVQVVMISKDNPGLTQVRTALENLTILSVQSQAETSSQGFTLPVITLLAKPTEADVLAAADAAARVRVTLRNPLDDATRSRAPLTTDSVMRTSGVNSESANGSGKTAGANPAVAAVRQ